MALKIKWTPQADNGLAIVIEYLEAEWTFLENFAMEENINQVANQISLFPDLYQNLKPIKIFIKAIDKNNYLVLSKL
jgi:hypothetical protein